jgi:hypothetical protein
MYPGRADMLCPFGISRFVPKAATEPQRSLAVTAPQGVSTQGAQLPLDETSVAG